MRPLNWRSTLDNTAASSVVTELKGLDGHGASMGGMQLTPTGTNNAVNKGVTVTLKKKGDLLQLFIGQAKVVGTVRRGSHTEHPEPLSK